MKNYLMLLVALVSTIALGAKITDDQLQLGQPGSTSAKKIKFSTTNSAELSIDHTTEELSYSADALKLGDGVDDDKEITFDKGGSNPQIKYDSATGKLQFSHDGATYKPFGSGTGSGGATGGINILTNQGFEDGVTAGWSATPAAASASYTNAVEGNEKYATWDATISGDKFQSTLTTKPDNISGGCMADINYNGGDANYTLKVLNASATPIATVALSAQTAWTKSPTLTFPCASSMQLSLEATGNGAAIQLDDAYLGSNKGFFPIDSVDNFSAKVATAGTVSTENKDWVSSNCTAFSGGSSTCTFVSGVFPSSAPNCTCTTDPSGNNRSCGVSSVTTSGLTIKVWQDDTGNTFNDTPVVISCSKSGVDATQAPLTGYASLPTHSRSGYLGAVINSSGSITSQTGSWLSSCTDTGTGSYTCNITAGVFTVTPSLIVDKYYSSTSGSDCTASVQTTTSFNISCLTPAGASVEVDGVHIMAVKQGNDFTNSLNVQNLPYLLKQVETAFSNGTRVEACQFSNTGTPAFVSNTCSSWIQSISAPGSGVYTVTLVGGLFSSAPICMGVTLSGDKILSTSATSTSSVSFLSSITTTGAASYSSQNHIFCYGAR